MLPSFARLAQDSLKRDPHAGDLYVFRGCACRKSNPNILVVQPAQDRAAKNGPGQFDGARERRILLQRQQYVTEVSLAEHNNVVKALPSARTDQPFGISVLPWGARRCRPVTNAH